MFRSEPRYNESILFNLPKMKCLNLHNNSASFFGDLSTPGSSVLQILFTSCDLLNVATC